MGAESKIEWTHHTFNPWWGCTKIDPECKNCYADSFAKRTGHTIWGDTAPRRFFGAKHWAEPLKWDREADLAGERRRVFCASMADVFEDRPDLVEPREALWRLIDETRNLDWLLLTKRPENMIRFSPPEFQASWPDNVWAGTSGGCQETADDNVPQLLKVPARVHFLSAEPLLEAVLLRDEWLHVGRCKARMPGDGHRCGLPEGHEDDHPHTVLSPTAAPWFGKYALDLVIVGAESGAKPRPMLEEFVRYERDQCVAAGVSFFYKQKLDEKRRKVSLPLLDGRSWAEIPEARV